LRPNFLIIFKLICIEQSKETDYNLVLMLFVIHTRFVCFIIKILQIVNNKSIRWENFFRLFFTK